MPNGIPIRGDDPEWKRKVDEELIAMKQQIDLLKSQINYLTSRSK